jgi:hypothetical protein
MFSFIEKKKIQKSRKENDKLYRLSDADIFGHKKEKGEILSRNISDKIKRMLVGRL